MTTPRSYDYSPTAWFYEALSEAYTCGTIRRAKAAQVSEFQPGDRVLYAGAGAGEDAVLAAQTGCHVTCVDVAPDMLARARRRFEVAEVPGEFICSDLIDYEPAAPFDAVAANFFLNVYAEARMRLMLGRLVGFLRPQGRLLIADFAPHRTGGRWARLTQAMFWYGADLFYWALGIMDAHSMHDYSAHLPEMGVALEKMEDHRVLRVTPFRIRTLVGRRRDNLRTSEGAAPSAPGRTPRHPHRPGGGHGDSPSEAGSA